MPRDRRKVIDTRINLRIVWSIVGNKIGLHEMLSSIILIKFIETFHTKMCCRWNSFSSTKEQLCNIFYTRASKSRAIFKFPDLIGFGYTYVEQKNSSFIKIIYFLELYRYIFHVYIAKRSSGRGVARLGGTPYQNLFAGPQKLNLLEFFPMIPNVWVFFKKLIKWSLDLFSFSEVSASRDNEGSDKGFYLEVLKEFLISFNFEKKIDSYYGKWKCQE